MPARSAGPFFSTPATMAPDFWSSPKESAISGVTSCGSTPIQPRVTEPVVMMLSSTLRAVDTGIAKPIPSEPPERE